MGGADDMLRSSVSKFNKARARPQTRHACALDTLVQLRMTGYPCEVQLSGTAIQSTE